MYVWQMQSLMARQQSPSDHEVHAEHKCEISPEYLFTTSTNTTTEAIAARLRPAEGGYPRTQARLRRQEDSGERERRGGGRVEGAHALQRSSGGQHEGGENRTPDFGAPMLLFVRASLSQNENENIICDMKIFSNALPHPCTRHS